MLTPEQFTSSCNKLISLVNAQAKLSTQAELGNDTTVNELCTAGRQLSDDMLRVLVMGIFNAGKSSFLNALMGQYLLPTKPIPATAIIGEIVYADKPSATLYPKKGTPGGTKPIEVKIEDLDKYILIDHEAASKDEVQKPSPYEKVVVKYPLSSCKNGVMFIDSPGLNDPTCHDAITQEYLPQADAIIYCMNGSVAFTAFDKNEIERLRAMGYRSIIFVLTYMDVLENNDNLMGGTHQADDARKHYTKILSPYTDLGASGIFFVSSLQALMGKKKQDARLLEASHFPPFEKRLEEILFNEKGRMKLLKPLYTARRANRLTGQQLSDLIDVANTDRNKLSGRIQEAQNNLRLAQEKAQEINKSFCISTNALVEGGKDLGKVFFLNEIIPHLEEWVDSFTPSDEQEISMLHPKRTGAAFAEGCVKHVQGQIEAKTAEWCENELVNNYLMPRLKSIAESQNANLEAFEEDLKNVRVSMDLSLDSEDISTKEDAGKTNRILAAILGTLLGGPVSGIMGGAYGWRGLASSLVTTLIGLTILGIVSMFTPVGWPALIVTLLSSLLVSSGWTGFNLEKRVKGEIVKKMGVELNKHQAEFIDSITNSINKTIQRMQQAVEDDLNVSIAKYKKLLDEAQQNVGSESSIQTRVARYTQLRKDNTQLAADLDAFAQDLNA